MIRCSDALLPRGSRRFVLSACAGLIALAASGSFAAAQTKVPTTELMAPGALPDIVQGKEGAPVTIIEYASMTCTHCAHFHEETYPSILKNYVDTGKVKFILREFPLDALAVAGFMLARCEGPDKRTAVADLLFDKQKTWAFVDKPVEALQALLKQTGMSSESFTACLKDTKLRDEIYKVGERGAKFGVDATPTFFVNGVKLSGEQTPDSMAKVIDPLLK